VGHDHHLPNITIEGYAHSSSKQSMLDGCSARQAMEMTEYGKSGNQRAVPTLPTLFGNPYGIPTFPSPRLLDMCSCLSDGDVALSMASMVGSISSGEGTRSSVNACFSRVLT